MDFMVYAKVYEGNLAYVEIEDRVLRALETAQLLTGAWTGIAFKDLPKEVQDGLAEVIDVVKSYYGDNCDPDPY